MNQNVYIKSYYGFGDNIFLFPFIKEASQKYGQVYLETSYPFLFHTLGNVKFIKPTGCSTLKTCQHYLNELPSSFWSKLPPDIITLKIPYYLTELKKNKTIPESFNEGIQITEEKIDYYLPLKPEWIKEAKKIVQKLPNNKKICIIKPPSNRQDWKNSARKPKVEYFQYLIDKYHDQYYFISVGNSKIEEFDFLDNIDLRYENGELNLRTIIGLVSLSDLVITFNCFLFPLGIATKTPTLVINGGYSDPNKYVDYKRMDLEHLKVVNPTNLCECFKLRHKCNKDINLDDLDNAMQELSNIKKIHTITYIKDKKNLLICRMRATNCEKIANNPWIKDHFNIFTIDHTSTNNYRNRGFKQSYEFPSVGNICKPELTPNLENAIRDVCYEIIKKHDIDLVLNAQPLHPYHELLDQVCMRYNIPIINTETAFDGKWLFDSVGCQYICPNEIYNYVNTIPLNDTNVSFPINTRQDQPNKKSNYEIYQKYNLDPHKKYIVILGQLLWDMSVKKTVNPDITTYEQYIDLLATSNPDTTFLIKYHPIYFSRHLEREMEFIKKYNNIIVINENLYSLFNTFEYFTSFSSTTIFEGLIRNKKFATIGFHYCNNDDLVLQLRVNDRAKNLIQKLEEFKINQATRLRYLKFICNYYTIDLSSKQLYDRLTLSSEEYFATER